MNAARQSIRNGDWSQGVRIAAAPLRSSLYRLRRRMGRISVSGVLAFSEPASVPTFSCEIHPLFVPEAKDLQRTVGLEQLFADVDKQIEGVFRLAGGGCRRVELESISQLSEAEDRHAVERLYWMARYARAGAFGHCDALTALRRSWTKWLGIAHGPIAFEAYTVAERIGSLSESLFWVRHCNAGTCADEIVSMKRQIWKDAHRLSANIEYGLGVHNHLLNDARGLFRASRVLPDLEEAAAWQEQAFCLWHEFFPKLVLVDGSFAEQSSHYQLLMCRTALEYFLAARRSRRALPAGSEARLSAMFEVANDLLRRDGSLPRFGDNSPDHTSEDLWGLMAAGYHCGLLKSCPRHKAITPLTLLYCGKAPKLPEAEPSHDRFYRHGGFMFLRSRDASVELTVHADPCPEVRAHGTSGRGSFELWWRGHVIVREPGSFLSSSNPRSAWSRSGLGQNVTCLNGLAPGVTAQDRKFLPTTYANQGGVWVVCLERQVSLRWDGFCRIRKGIVLWRTWQFDRTGDLSFEERIDGSGELQFESRFCLGNGRWEINHRDSDRSLELHWTGPEGCSLSLSLDLPPGVNSTLATGCYIPEFGVEQQAPVFVLSGSVRLPVCWTAKWHFSAASHEISSELRQQCAG
jgi:hypothetical protein